MSYPKFSLFLRKLCNHILENGIEKEDRTGNVKFDLNLGLDNQRFGVTGNVGYDTKGENVRGGVGLRVIF